MDDWYNKKMKKIKEKKDEIEKNDPSKKECKFKPYINDNAHIKKEDQNLTCSDRLYLEYFTLRDKKNTMRQKKMKIFLSNPMSFPIESQIQIMKFKYIFLSNLNL